VDIETIKNERVKLAANISELLWAILDALFYPPLCRLGFHRWETPPFPAWVGEIPQFKPYEQCTRIGCWKTRYADGSIEELLK
jgi:hypothetical protein